jgi:hypothetical protein
MNENAMSQYNSFNSGLMSQHGSEASVGVTRSDFGGVSNSRENAATTALAAKARAEAEAKYLMALHRPRNIAQVRALILRECSRPGFAEQAIFHKPVGEGIEGLSIRFAEAAARCYRNLSIEVQQIYDDAHTRTVRVIVCDLESNTPWSMDVTLEKTVERRHLRRNQVPLGQRVNNYGDTVYIVEGTEDDLLNKQNALVSKAIRTCILRVIPGDIQDEAFAACKKILADQSAKDPASAKNALLDGLARLGVMPVEVEEWLGHSIESMSSSEFNSLRGAGVAIRDGEATWAQVMEVRRQRKAETAAEASSPTSPVGMGTKAVKDALRRKSADRHGESGEENGAKS